MTLKDLKRYHESKEVRVAIPMKKGRWLHTIAKWEYDSTFDCIILTINK